MDRAAEEAFDHPALGAETLPELLVSTARRRPEATAQRYKGGVYNRSLAEVGAVSPAPDGEFVDLSYADLAALVERLAAGLRAGGLNAGDRVSVVSHTRMEWTQLDFAILAAGGVVSTVYPSATTDRLEYLLSDAEPTGVVVENSNLLRTLLEIEADLNFDLKFIVVIDSLPDGSGMAAAARDREDIITLGTLYERGAATFDAETFDSWLSAIVPDDLASLIYTSGTTGEPKGVRLTHKNCCANVDQAFRRFGPRPDRAASVPSIDHTSRHLSVLPLSHVFERLAGSFLMIAAGATIAYAESTETLATDFQSVRPTVCTGVPRLYQGLFDRFEQRASESTVGERVFQWAVAVATQYYGAEDPSRRLRLAHRVADRLVYQQVRDGVGGALELCISGGDSLSADLCATFHGMGIPIFEGYGLTETAPVLSANPPEAPDIGTIGPPLSGVQTRIDTTVSVDGVGTTVDETAVGELLVSGPNVTPGYWNRPDETEAAFVSLDNDTKTDSENDSDGDEQATTTRWFRTGDIVDRRPSGYLVFRERRKQLVVLSTGKNVAPTPIEDRLEAHSLIEHALVVGDGRPAVAALVVPDFDAVARWANRESRNIPTEPDQLIKDEQLIDAIKQAVDSTNDSLEPHERIQAVELLDSEFTVDNGLLTPTMKPRRAAITERYATRIDQLYDEQPN